MRTSATRRVETAIFAVILALCVGIAFVVRAESDTPALRDLLGGRGEASGEASPDTEPSSAEETPQSKEQSDLKTRGGGDSAVNADDRADAEAGGETDSSADTPRAAVSFFLDAAADRDYERAATVLQMPSRLSARFGETPASMLARQLEIVLDKKVWIDVGTVSDAPEGDLDDGLPAGRERLTTIEVGGSKVPILLARVAGSDGYEWKIAASTVANIPRLYEAHGYGALGRYLPEFFFELRVLEIQLWQWIGLFALLLLAGVVAWAAASATAAAVRLLLQRSSERVDEKIISVVTGPARLAIGVAFFSAGKYALGMAVGAVAVFSAIEDLLYIVAIAWTAMRLINVLSGFVERRLDANGQESAVALLPPGRKTLKGFTLVLAGLAVLDNMGFNVTGVIAGLGVGGIAVALAAQKTVENLFGGVTLYADRPVRVGDFCRFGDRIGTVEEIGIRSTRIRTLDRTLVAVPNNVFAGMSLENFTERDRIWYHPRIGLRYETTPDQLRYVLVEIRRMLYAHPKVDPDPARIRFVEFGAYSLDLDVFAYVNVTDYGEYLEVAEDLNLRIMDIVEGSGTGFAFPSQTTYIEQGEPLDEKRQEEVRQRVEDWRERGELYLPRFPDEEIRSLRGSIDFPPKGSPSAGGNGASRE